MESSGGSSATYITTTAAVSAAMPSPSNVADTSKATQYEFDPSVTEEERRFYLKAYPTVDVVRDRKTHCTVCKVHIGTAPVQENGIKMHPILRVTHCNKCHDFYNSGEFSKGEDGSELYCRWCGQGGEVYCCSSCPYVFCKSCIVKNLSRGVVADIEQNENWNCFSCAPKILWPLRAQHWALMNYIEQQKKEIYAMNLSEAEIKQYLSKDRSKCCRLAKAKCGNMSDSMESLDSIASKRSHVSSNSAKKPIKHPATPSPQQINPAKRAKNNDEVVCTPDLLSMLEPDCQITVSSKTNRSLNVPSASTPKIMSIQQPPGGYGAMSSAPKSSVPPPLVLRNTAVKLRPVAPPPVVRRTIIGPRTPNPGGNGTPVYHTINGYRIDLNSAAQQETFRLPNGKLIQVKRQGPPPNISPSPNNWQQMTSPQPQRVIPQTIASRAVQITPHHYNISVQQTQPPQVVRYHSNIIGSTSINPVNQNGSQIQVLNGQMPGAPQPHSVQQHQQTVPAGPIRPVMVRHVFPDNPVGQARSGLQDQVFNAMEICTHLTNKVQTLTNSNAYKQARNFLEVKELYIHLSYLLTYAIGRFKSLQDKCLGDMRTLGFGNDADCLENGQLAADKQASDDEDNEIEIVEPKTDLITLDSDDEEPTAFSTSSRTKTNAQSPIKSIQSYPNSPSSDVKVKPVIPPASIASKRTDVSQPVLTPISAPTTGQTEENVDLMSMAQSFLASMLEVDIQEVNLNSPGSDSSGQKKQPRKKLTSKPNPTLLKQKALMERERLEELKRNDLKLKMKCSVELQKAEDEYPFAKSMLEARVKEKREVEDANQKQNEEMEKEKLLKLLVETDKETVEVELFMEEENVNSPTGANKTLEDKNATSNELNEIKENESNDSIREVKEQSTEASIIGDNENRDDEDYERNVSIAESKSGDKTELIEDVNDLKNKELNEENKETESETSTKTSETIKEENEIVEDKTQNGIDKINAELLDDTDEDKIENCIRTPSEAEVKESLENINKSTETTKTKIDVSVNKEIEKFQQLRHDNANDNENAKPNDKLETSNNVLEEVIIKEITLDITSKEPMTSSIDTRVPIAETSSITTTSNGSV